MPDFRPLLKKKSEIHDGSKNHRQMNLCFRAAMPHRPQQLRIDSAQPCQCPRIVAIIFSSALGDQIHLLRVRHEHFVSQLL